MMQIKQLTPLTRIEIDTLSRDLIVQRIVFLWDLRDDDFNTYMRHGLNREKEVLYRLRHIEVGIAGSMNNDKKKPIEL
jgi:hypothetical protein